MVGAANHEKDAATRWRVAPWDTVPALIHGFLGRADGLGPGAFDLAAIRRRLAGVVERGVAALVDRYGAAPDTVQAAVGPAICGTCYEFGAEYLREFVARYGADAETAWRPGASSERGYLDVRRLATIALGHAGLAPDAVSLVGPCTAEHPRALHSYRRDGAGAGRQLSYVGWRADR